MKGKVLLLVLVPFLFLAGCGESTEHTEDAEKAETIESSAMTDDQSEEEEAVKSESKETVLKMTIGDHAVEVEWEDNESVDALLELAKENPVTVQMSMYGGFEQVGSLGTNLPRNDVQTTTEAGDIVLYSGNQIVVFYGSNSWTYTRFGHITGKTAGEMAELLGNGDVTITLSVE